MITRRSILLSSAAALRAATGQEVGFCIGTYGMKSLPTEAALRLIATTGYDGVELALMPGWPTDPATMSPADRSRLRAMLREFRLQVPSLNDQLPITENSRSRNIERLRLAADLAHDLAPKAPPLIETMLGGRTSDWYHSRGFMADELRAWAELAEQRDVTVCFKPHAGHAIHNVARALEMLHMVSSQRLRVCYDYCHMFVARESLENSLRQLLPVTGFITLKDARWTETGHEFLLPGDGDTDYKSYFRLLKELGYRRWVAVEVSAMVFRKPGYDPHEAARKTYDAMAPFWSNAGLKRRARRS
ncbi:MAG TPA: sugar phosphate isomerase/epimerase family protein [Bryobacteraceae bacterium]|nr:sugar phosphate isomerase/epimerase family protein [Bryobacteraceae bacterium]